MSSGPSTPEVHRFASLIYNLLVRTAARRTHAPYRWFWSRLHECTQDWNVPVKTVIHERPVRVNYGYTYPIYARLFPSLNNPLVELVHQSWLSAGRAIELVDLGPAVGDTVLLIEANCPGMVASFLCIDGDPEFFSYLKHNLSLMPHCRCVLRQVSASARADRSLVRTHAGTASAQGMDSVQAYPLTEILPTEGMPTPDIIKIDIDGFDGEAIAGSTSLLRDTRPSVIFEWHPALCEKTGNNAFRAFSALHAAGYEQTLWFTKYGHFSHFGGTSVDANLNRLHDFCLRSRHEYDWHYDVIALPPDSRLDTIALAEMEFARKRRSRC